MTSFVSARFERMTFERKKGPAEKRRLQKRLEERRRRKGLPALTPPPEKPYTPSTPTPDQHKAIRVARAHRKFRRKIKERQRLAARSGLPELDRRAKWQSGRAAQARALKERATTEGCPRICVVESGTAEEHNEVSFDARQRTPDETHMEDTPPWL